MDNQPPRDPEIQALVEEVTRHSHTPLASKTVGNTEVQILADRKLSRTLSGTHGPRERVIVYRTVDYGQFDPALFESCCQYLEQGGSLYKFCLDRGLDRGQFWRWVMNDAETRQRYLQAQEIQGFDAMMEARYITQQLCDLESLAERIPPGREKLSNALVNALVNGAKLQVEVAKRLCPHLYGDRIEVKRDEHSISYVVSFASEQPSKTTKGKRISGETIDLLPPGTLRATKSRSKGGKTKSTPPSKADSST